MTTKVSSLRRLIDNEWNSFRKSRLQHSLSRGQVDHIASDVSVKLHDSGRYSSANHRVMYDIVMKMNKSGSDDTFCLVSGIESAITDVIYPADQMSRLIEECEEKLNKTELVLSFDDTVTVAHVVEYVETVASLRSTINTFKAGCVAATPESVVEHEEAVFELTKPMIEQFILIHNELNLSEEESMEFGP